MICSYCEFENVNNQERCSFCDAPLNIKRPRLKEFVYIEQSELPFDELKEFHIFDLLVLLRLIREQRTISYKLMRTLQKAPEMVEVDSASLNFAEKDYRRYTARMKLIEGILIDRMGYKPKRIDDKLLQSLKMKMQNG